MRFLKICAMVVVCAVSGCNKEIQVQPHVNDGAVVICETKNIIVNTVSNKATVYRYHQKPEFGNTRNIITIKGQITGEYVVVDITGKIKKFEYISLLWDGTALREKKILKSFENLENRKIVIDTYFSEGSPAEKIRITDIRNTTYECEFNEKDLQ